MDKIPVSRDAPIPFPVTIGHEEHVRDQRHPFGKLLMSLERSQRPCTFGGGHDSRQMRFRLPGPWEFSFQMVRQMVVEVLVRYIDGFDMR